jgi:hypothetical protein
MGICTSLMLVDRGACVMANLMSGKKKLIGAAMLFLLLLPVALLAFSNHTDCRAPVVLRNRREADRIIAGRVERFGGLPRMESDPAGPGDVSVRNHLAGYEIEALTVGNSKSLIASLRDDDPIYTYTIDLRTSHTDGNEQRFRLSGWRYGLVICPIVAVSGDGPPGNLVIRHQQNR